MEQEGTNREVKVGCIGYLNTKTNTKNTNMNTNTNTNTGIIQGRISAKQEGTSREVEESCIVCLSSLPASPLEIQNAKFRLQNCLQKVKMINIKLKILNIE